MTQQDVSTSSQTKIMQKKKKGTKRGGKRGHKSRERRGKRMRGRLEEEVMKRRLATAAAVQQSGRWQSKREGEEEKGRRGRRDWPGRVLSNPTLRHIAEQHRAQRVLNSPHNTHGPTQHQIDCIGPTTCKPSQVKSELVVKTLNQQNEFYINDMKIFNQKQLQLMYFT